MQSSRKLNNFLLFGSIFVIFYLKIIIEIFVFKIPFSHDTLATFQIFTYNYNYFDSFTKFPLWLDYVDHGQPALFTTTFYYPGIFFPIIILSSLIDLSPLNSFIFGISLINLFFIFGIYLNICKFKNKYSIIIFLSFLYCFTIDTSFIIHSYAFWSLIIPYGIYYFNKFFEKKKISDLLNFSLIFLSYVLIYTTYYHVITFYLLFLLFFLFLIFYTYQEKGWLFDLKFKTSDILRILTILILIFLIISYFSYIEDNYFFSTQGERTADGNVTLNDLIYYANYPFLTKIYKFLNNGLIQNEYGFQYPLFFLYLIVFFFFQKNKLYFKKFLIFFFILIIFFIISNPVDLSLSRNLLSILYNYFPGIDKFRHSGYIINLTLPILFILIALILENYLKNYKNIDFGKKNIFISITVSFIFLLGYFLIDQFKNFFVFALITSVILFISFSNFLKLKINKYKNIYLSILLISTLPFYLFSIKNAKKDEQVYLVNLINKSDIQFTNKCVGKEQIDDEYKINNLPGIKSSFFFLISKNKPCYNYYKASVYGSIKNHTESINTKGGSEIYFTSLTDLIELSNFVKKYNENLNFNEEELINSVTKKLNIEPKTFYYRIIKIGKYLDPENINNLEWPKNFRQSLELIIKDTGEIIFDKNKINLFRDNNKNKNLYSNDLIKIKKINNENFHIKNFKNLNEIETFITYSNKWIIKDNENYFDNRIVNKNGYVKIIEINKIKDFNLLYEDNAAYKMQLILLIISSIFILNFLIQIIKIKN